MGWRWSGIREEIFGVKVGKEKSKEQGAKNKDRLQVNQNRGKKYYVTGVEGP
jgi:hypothetical protein